MDDKSKIIETLKNHLQHLESVHAMWLEGSLAEKDNDEYSDLDIWLSVDDKRLRSIFDDVEKALETIAQIDFKFELKPSGELGHNVYHLAGMSEFLTLDINTQKFSRDIVLREEIDLYETIFDKAGLIRTMPRESINFNKAEQLAELIKFIDYTALSVKKNALRGKKIESREYYRNILVRVSEYLRKKSDISEKTDFGFKHCYKDIPKDEVIKLEAFYFADVDDDTIESLKSWLKSI
ncbi:nucleotidyltransferase domain-containing protein [Candidatus Saccharibacteria bacterium]|nr:nucleotidyltransferase domain-containing protein [Candidatus Saccharibacteria bacterium]NCU40699.1 nucleotidyltransferase domain-containing protein [Candidatus Saccharibacteria bacterium]